MSKLDMLYVEGPRYYENDGVELGICDWNEDEPHPQRKTCVNWRVIDEKPEFHAPMKMGLLFWTLVAITLGVVITFAR
jgi:hypothetical protein